MTQEDVASKLFVTKQAVSRWENGNCLPDVASLDNLAKLYGVSIDYLLTGEENVKIEKEIQIVEEEKIVEVEKPLSDEMLRVILSNYHRSILSIVGCLALGIPLIIVGVILIIKCLDTPSIIFCPILLMIGGLIGTIGGLYNLKRFKKLKAKYEEEAGRKIKLFKYEDK